LGRLCQGTLIISRVTAVLRPQLTALSTILVNLLLLGAPTLSLKRYVSTGTINRFPFDEPAWFLLSAPSVALLPNRQGIFGCRFLLDAQPGCSLQPSALTVPTSNGIRQLKFIGLLYKVMSVVFSFLL
jgi:hypothetical protein